MLISLKVETTPNGELTGWWGEEVEEGISSHRLGDNSNISLRFVLLLLLDCPNSNILPLLPVDFTP